MIKCSLCDAGFPLIGDSHIPTQRLGMIPVTRCPRLVKPPVPIGVCREGHPVIIHYDKCPLCSATAEWQDWERWAREVLTDFKIPFDNHKVGMRLAITQWMKDLSDWPLSR